MAAVATRSDLHVGFLIQGRVQIPGTIPDSVERPADLEDKKKHPFINLEALYHLILRTRNDVNMSVNATAVCLAYSKHFIAVLRTSQRSSTSNSEESFRPFLLLATFCLIAHARLTSSATKEILL